MKSTRVSQSCTSSDDNSERISNVIGMRGWTGGGGRGYGDKVGGIGVGGGGIGVEGAGSLERLGREIDFF